MLITKRTLDRRDGVEGPRHDPYGYTEYEYVVNDDVYVAHFGLVDWLEVNGVIVANTHVAEKFESVIGMSVDQFESAYWRIHPYFEDPMGPISWYI